MFAIPGSDQVKGNAIKAELANALAHLDLSSSDTPEALLTVIFNAKLGAQLMQIMKSTPMGSLSIANGWQEILKLRAACASRADFSHRHYSGASPAGPGANMLDFARVPELQSLLPALEKQSAQWLHWDGSRLADPFDSGKLTSWSNAEEIDNYFQHYTAASAAAEAGATGIPRLYVNTAFVAAMHGRLDVYAHGKQLCCDLLTGEGDLGRGLWVGADVYVSVIIQFSGMDVLGLDHQFYEDISTDSGLALIYKGTGNDTHGSAGHFAATQPMFKVLPAGPASLTLAKLELLCILLGRVDKALSKEDIHIDGPEEMWANFPEQETSTIFINQSWPLAWLATLANLMLGRFDEAMAHADRFERNCWGPQVPCQAPWIRAKIMVVKAKAAGAADTDPVWPEVVALLQASTLAARKFESPLFVALALQDLLAVAPPSALGGEARALVRSELEEAKFDLTFPEEGVRCPLAEHLNGDEEFVLLGLDSGRGVRAGLRRLPKRGELLNA